MQKVCLLFLILSTGLLAGAQNKHTGFTLSGDMKGITDPYIYLRIPAAGSVTIDSTLVKAGHFEFRGKVAGPTMAYIQTRRNSVEVFLENARIHVAGPIDSAEGLTITGSASELAYDSLKASTAATRKQEEQIYQQYQEAYQKKDSAAEAAVETRLAALRKERRAIIAGYIAGHPKSPVSVYEISMMTYGSDYPELETLFLSLDASARNSAAGTDLAKKLAVLKKSAIGQPVIDFTQNDVNGQPVRFSQLSKGKYVLLDFWASWCGPCRAENPNVLKAYNHYNSRGLEIIGVSLDTDSVRWKKAIREDGMPWMQVSDLKGWKNEVAQQYGIQGIPFNFLVSPDGVIVAKNLRGTALEQRLAEIMPSMPLAGRTQDAAGQMQDAGRQHTLDSLQEVIESQKDSLPALRQYISILGLSNDTVTTRFKEWMKAFPKSPSIPYALGEAYYRARDHRSANYFMKAYGAGDTSGQLIRMLRVALNERWQIDVPRTANTVDSLKKVVENNPDSLLPAQQYIFVLGNTNDTAIIQADAWMKQFPRSTALPFAMGESYYNDESPRAKPYLMRVVELEPKNAKVWEMLSVDAYRWGNDEMARLYMGEAAAADPGNSTYAFSYAYSFEKVDTAMWRKKTGELTKRFPHDEKGAAGLYWLAYGSPWKEEKRNTLEQLRKLYPPSEFSWSENGMNYLYDLYLQEGLTDKAIELAASMGGKDGFPEKLELAKNVATVRELIKENKYPEAQGKIVHIKAPRYSQAANAIILLKAEVIAAAGSPQAAYDSLLLVQAKTPDDGIRTAIAKYGTRLGKSVDQTEKDIWSMRNKTSRPAPPFELGLYTSNGKTRLEDYRGKAILLTFWFPGCGPCRAEMPHFQNVVNKYDKKDLAYLGINVSPEQDDYVLPFMNGTKFSFTPLRGNGKWAQEVYHVRGEPTNFLIDQEGKIIYSNFMIDGNNERTLELMINSMMAKKG